MVTEQDLVNIEEQAKLAKGTPEEGVWEVACSLMAELYLMQGRIKKIELKVGGY